MISGFDFPILWFPEVTIRNLSIWSIFNLNDVIRRFLMSKLSLEHFMIQYQKQTYVQNLKRRSRH